MNRIILASKSPRRKELLERRGILFDIICSDADEISSCENLRELPLINAKLKAKDISNQNQNATVIGADTVILDNDKIIGKPKNLEDAKEILQSLSNRTHSVLTGVSIINQAKAIDQSFVIESLVTFKKIDIDVINEYLRKVNVLDKAGAYAIQEESKLIIKSYKGSLDNIIGLPVDEVVKYL